MPLNLSKINFGGVRVNSVAFEYPEKCFTESSEKTPPGAAPKRGNDVYFKADILCKSLDGRNVWMFTLDTFQHHP